MLYCKYHANSIIAQTGIRIGISYLYFLMSGKFYANERRYLKCRACLRSEARFFPPCEEFLWRELMKKLGVLLLAAAFAVFGLFSFAACNEETLGPGDPDDPIVTPGPDDPTPPEEEPEATEGLIFDLIDGVSYAVMEYVGTSAEVYIPSTYQGLPVTYIGDEAFYGCSSLTSIRIPDSVTSIGYQAFEGCESLTSIVIPDSVTYIGWDAFSYCYGLTSIDIPDSVTFIGTYAFRDCSSLTSITIGDGITSIGRSVFPGCSSLTSITIPDSVTSIGDEAFYGCDSLTSITIPDSVTSIGDSAFEWCSGLTSIAIPDGVTSIGSQAFSRCGSLTSVTIGDSVTSIGDWAFNGCSSLTSIIVDPQNPVYHSDGNCLIETESKTLIAGCGASVIPADGSVTEIGGHAFDGCDSLTSITIPDSVTEIGGYAFSGCDSLTSVTIGDGVTSIGYGAFDGCDSLTTVYYTGSEAEWNEIGIGRNNDELLNAEIVFNYKGE